MDIIESGEFWCSLFWEMNDPMEGVFYANLDLIPPLSEGKNNYKICSFSSIYGFNNPLLWGYYANGFKGVVIEIDINIELLNDNENIEEIDYVPDLSMFRRDDSDDETVKKILTTKLNKWENEYEWRYLVKSENNKNRIGKISKIYFGFPYANVINSDDMKNKKTFQKYFEKIKELKKLLIEKDIPYTNVKVSEDGEVIINEEVR
jgi:hypothetical protein